MKVKADNKFVLKIFSLFLATVIFNSSATVAAAGEPMPIKLIGLNIFGLDAMQKVPRADWVPSPTDKIDESLNVMLQNASLLNKKVDVIIVLSDQSQNLVAQEINMEYEEKMMPHRNTIKKIYVENKNEELIKANKKGAPYVKEEEPDFSEKEIKEISLHNTELKTLKGKMRTAIRDSREIQSILNRTQEPVIREITEKYHGKVGYRGFDLNVISAEIPLKYVKEIASRTDVAQVSEDDVQYDVTDLDKSVPTIKADRLWNKTGKNGSFVGTFINKVVAIVDSGVNTSHSSLKFLNDAATNRIWYNGDFSRSGEGWGDVYGHGTPVAGVVASSSNTRTGVLPNITKMINAKIINSTNSIGKWEYAIGAISWSVYGGTYVVPRYEMPNSVTDSTDTIPQGNEADVISNSWCFHDNTNGTSSLTLFIDSITDGRDVVSVFAAGNDGPNNKTLRTPGDAFVARLLLPVQPSAADGAGHGHVPHLPR